MFCCRQPSFSKRVLIIFVLEKEALEKFIGYSDYGGFLGLNGIFI